MASKTIRLALYMTEHCSPSNRASVQAALSANTGIVSSIRNSWQMTGSPSLPGFSKATRHTARPRLLGLTYTLVEGAPLDTMECGDTKQGNGEPWTTTITVNGGTSGFYRIKVDK